MFRITALFEGKQPVCNFRQAFEAIQKDISDVELNIYNTLDIDLDDEIFGEAMEQTAKADFLILHFHGSMSYFKKYLKFQDSFQGKKPYFFYSSIESEMEEMIRKSMMPRDTFMELLPYVEAGGEENRDNFLLCLLNRVAGIDCPYGKPSIPVRNGYYNKPDGMSDEEYRHQISVSSQPVVGVLVHFHTIQSGNTEHLDQLYALIEKNGCRPVIMYSGITPSADGKGGGLREDLKRYMMIDGHSLPQSMIITTGHSLSVLSSPGCGENPVTDSVFEILGVPAIHALHTDYSYEQWMESVRGMDPMYLGNVYTAEYDGQIISVPMTCTEHIQTPFGIKDKPVLIRERADKIVKLAKNWARLSMIPPQDKRIAIILHNMPPRADMIGCAYGLDTPESVYEIVCALKEQGYTLSYDFAGGKEIIERITSGLTNDGRFLSPQELLERAEATIDPQQWQRWFPDLPGKARLELKRDWGEAPGDVMTVGEKILVPCIINGNILIGLQPPRACEEKAEECYHSTELVCPYQYIAFYRYLEQVFGADAVIHVGTHGTVEWLPGKEIGLSNGCYPDIAIGTLPHLYPYIIDVPGEGAQAKRRTAACIIDHLIPSMTEGGVYGDIGVIDELLTKYYHGKQNGNSKVSHIAEQIQKAACKLGLDKDLDLSQEDFEHKFEETAEKLHLWVSEIKSSEIKDGLHIFGLPPKGERLSNMLRLMVRVKNGRIPSLRQGICSMMGWNLDDLVEHPQVPDEWGVTNAMKLERADEMGRKIFRLWQERSYDIGKIDSIVEEVAAEESMDMSRRGELLRCLTFVREYIYPRLESTVDEIGSLIKGLEGRFVPKGSSGAPSRGNAHILPTGRNFYTTDPTEIPTRSAWETGKRLADQLVEAYRSETGKIPEDIAIVVYSGETIKTNGDDIAEILYLYGIHPVWLGETDKVIGLKVIPLEELGRPRIDVTLRISGLFRDTFPNLIELVDEAVNMVAGLQEDGEQNYIKKHVEKDVMKYMKEGMSRQLAYDQASLRIFGCPPGTYGAGVDILINSRKWETADDLGKAYITWSGHGYSRKVHGDKVQNLFAHRLSNCDVTVKNISSCEADMLDSDDFYNYHGGLISAVKSQKGTAPVSYSTDASDAGHVVTKNIRRETARIMRARINNPKWIEGMKKHGFKGAQEFSAMVDIIFGWDATSDVIEDYMYDSVFETYLNDPELREWIKEENPWALHAMSERMLEAVQRGMWSASEDKVETLQKIYLEMEGSLEGDD